MKKIEQYFKELLEQHPYKQAGNRDSYSQYNEGWQDALDLAIQVSEKASIEYAISVLEELHEKNKYKEGSQVLYYKIQELKQYLDGKNLG